MAPFGRIDCPAGDDAYYAGALLVVAGRRYSLLGNKPERQA
jgi:hypothetical protein